MSTEDHKYRVIITGFGSKNPFNCNERSTDTVVRHITSILED